MIAIRAMTVDDVDRVRCLEERTPEAPHWDRKAYEQFLATGTGNLRSAAWVADGSELVGFVMARLIVDVCELESIVVAEDLRGRGIGGALLKTTLGWAAAQGAKKMELEVRAGNETAIRFYERAGMVREGVRRGYYRDPDEDALLMGKSLYSGD
jgi:[ribosomal protein S18]-alanine N-acetyltransferase